MRSFAVLSCSLIVSAVAATAALAGGNGGVAAAEPPTSKRTKAVPVIHAPVTAKSSNVAYKGPVYERTATGAVVPFVAPTNASATTGTAASSTGGSVATSAQPVVPSVPGELTSGNGMTAAKGPTPRPDLLVPGSVARFVDGLAAAPEGAPAAVQQIIWAGNELIGLPYVYGGGHASFVSAGYDCSGTVSFALHGASLLGSTADSSEFMAWGSGGIGRWVTIFSNPEHAYMTVAGLRLDTSAADDPSNEQGPRWRPLRRSNGGYSVRHPTGV